MTDPFLIKGPAVVSFSGGRTSAYMLRRILDAHGGTLPWDVRVVFANTGKERPETLDFVEACAQRWSVPIIWVEYRVLGRFMQVSHATASRDGRPFDYLLSTREGYLPNTRMRLCTQELKIRPIKAYMRHRGFAHWTMVVGLRSDEPRRVARMRAPTRERWENALPLADAGVTEADVLAFWRAQPFDLALQPHEGNCDLCFMKGVDKRLRIIADRPDLAAWWIEWERRTGQRFRRDTPDYAALVEQARTHLPVLREDPTDVGDCACTD